MGRPEHGRHRHDGLGIPIRRVAHQLEAVTHHVVVVAQGGGSCSGRGHVRNVLVGLPLPDPVDGPPVQRQLVRQLDRRLREGADVTHLVVVELSL